MDIFSIKIRSRKYPPLLEEIHRPPSLLYVRGNLPSFDGPIVAVVGTRYPSNYGKEMTQFFTEYLARAGCLIVSGFAAGIDFIAHQTAIESGGKTVAVLGTGVDIVYPPENRHYERTLLQNGAFISQFPPRTQAKKYSFPQRNEIIAGMSHAALVVEAPEKSGALITAEFALEYGRAICAVPGNIGQKNSVGTNQLIHKSGALLVTHPAEIIEQLKIQPALFPIFHRKIQPQLSREEKQICDLLESDPLHIDALIEKTGFSASLCGNLLMQLQLKKLIDEEAKVYRSRTV